MCVKIATKESDFGLLQKLLEAQDDVETISYASMPGGRSRSGLVPVNSLLCVDSVRMCVCV